MRIFITIDDVKIDGYLMLSPSTGFDFNSPSLDKWVDDGEAEEIIVNEGLEYVPIQNIIDVLTSWAKKLKHGGKIVISGVDVYAVSKAFVEYGISIEEFNLLIHGLPGTNKTANLTCRGISRFLESLNLHIQHRRIEVYKFMVEAIRK